MPAPAPAANGRMGLRIALAHPPTPASAGSSAGPLHRGARRAAARPWGLFRLGRQRLGPHGRFWRSSGAAGLLVKRNAET